MLKLNCPEEQANPVLQANPVEHVKSKPIHQILFSDKLRHAEKKINNLSKLRTEPA